MELSGLMSGGAPILKKYTVAADVDNPGVLVTDGGANSDGVIPITTDNAIDVVGLAYDTATYTQTQGAEVATVTVAINPDAIIKARLAGTATTGSALVSYACTSAASDGLSVITTEFDVASPSLDEGTVWGADGPNLGVSTYITAVATNDATVTMPFAAISVGDGFYYSSVSPHRTILAQTTTDFLEIENLNVTSTDCEFVIIDMDLQGSLDSYAYFLCDGHLFAGTL